jgi:hypothetical protein
MEVTTPSDIVTEVLSLYNPWVPVVKSSCYGEVFTGKVENNTRGIYNVDGISFGYYYKENVYLTIPLKVGKRIYNNQGAFNYRGVFYSNRTIAHFISYLSCYLFCKENPDIFALLYRLSYKGQASYNIVNVNYIIIGESIYEEWKAIRATKKEK